MIVDSSAIISICLGEPEAADFAEALSTDEPAIMSVANWLESSIVADRRGHETSVRFDTTMRLAKMNLVPVTADQAKIAREAHRRFGRGSGSPARLNYGDCFAYALAITTGDTLLFKGDDFTHTDIRSALQT